MVLALRAHFFKVLEVDSCDPYVEAFLDFYKDDIREWYPDFGACFNEESLVLPTLGNLAVAGIFAGSASDDSTLSVELDFAVPRYADRKVGRHLYNEGGNYFSSRGFRQLDGFAADKFALEIRPMQARGSIA